MENKTDTLPLRIGISSCLLGEQVRFDGGHKRDRYLTDTLPQFVEWVPVCPELEVGMGVPREPVRLVGAPETPRMVGIDTKEDWTDRMVRFSERRIGQLQKLQLDGYILKSDSPSCGMERVKLYSEKGILTKNGTGLFAAALLKALPSLPVEEEGRLNDEKIRDNFIIRIFSYHRLQQMMSGRMGIGELVAFHARHKYLLLAHSPKHYIALGKFVAGAKRIDRQVVKKSYAKLFMEGLTVKSTAKKHTNVLQHMLGFFHEKLSKQERKNIADCIDEYRQGLVPLIAPVTLIRHYVSIHDIAYLKDQVYLHPHPKELLLRNRP